MRSVFSSKPTERVLVLLRNALLAMVTVTLAVSWLSFRAVDDTVDTVRTATAPAMLGIANARIALAEAERSVNESFAKDRALLTGPGEQYQNAINLASQTLTLVAEDNVAGDYGRATLRSIEVLLIDYIGLIEQADAQQDRTAAEVPALVTANLWYASGLMDEMLQKLDALLALQRAELTHQIGAGAPRALAVDLTPLALAAALLVLLVVVQRRLRRHFRRQVNVALLAATALVTGIAVITVLSMAARYDLDTAADTLDDMAESRGKVAADTRILGNELLREFFEGQCVDVSCGESVKHFREMNDPGPAVDPASNVEASVTMTDSAMRAVADASVGGLEPLLPLAAAGVGTLVSLGFRPRLEEYRYLDR